MLSTSSVGNSPLGSRNTSGLSAAAGSHEEGGLLVCVPRWLGCG